MHQDKRRSIKDVELYERKMEKKGVDIFEASIGFGKWQYCIIVAFYLCKIELVMNLLDFLAFMPDEPHNCLKQTLSCNKNCTKYIYDFTINMKTPFSEWNLICKRSYLVMWMEAIYVAGFMFGNAIFGLACDYYGRRWPIIIGICVQVAFTALCAFSTWFWFFLVCRFIIAATVGGLMTSTFVLLTEIVGTEKRTIVGGFYSIPYPIVFLLMAGFSKVITNWRYYLFILCLYELGILTFIVTMLPESPRWLLMQNRIDEAIDIMVKAARMNNLEEEPVKTNLEKHVRFQEYGWRDVLKDFYGNLLLFKYILCISLFIFLDAGCSIYIYAMLSNIEQKKFYGFLILSASHTIGISTGVGIIYFFGRKVCILISNVTSGITCLIIALTPIHSQWIKISILNLAILFLCMNFAVVHLYAAELFPTLLRALSIAHVYIYSQIFEILKQYITSYVLIAREVHVILLVISAVLMLSSLLLIILPETSVMTLCDVTPECVEWNFRLMIKSSIHKNTPLNKKQSQFEMKRIDRLAKAQENRSQYSPKQLVDENSECEDGNKRNQDIQENFNVEKSSKSVIEKSNKRKKRKAKNSLSESIESESKERQLGGSSKKIETINLREMMIDEMKKERSLRLEKMRRASRSKVNGTKVSRVENIENKGNEGSYSRIKDSSKKDKATRKSGSMESGSRGSGPKRIELRTSDSISESKRSSKNNEIKGSESKRSSSNNETRGSESKRSSSNNETRGSKSKRSSSNNETRKSKSRINSSDHESRESDSKRQKKN